MPAVLKTFRNTIRTSDFAISAEIFLRAETNADAIRTQADVVRDAVDGILLTDNQFGQFHLAPIAAAAILLDHGVDPIVHVTSRNRNRIAILSDMLGAYALGVTTLLLSAGERPAEMMKPRPKPVLDLNAVELIQTADVMNHDETLSPSPDFLLGALVTPIVPKPDWPAKGLREKIDAGAQYVQTHLCMDVGLLRHYLKRLVEEKLIRRTSVIASVALVESVEDAKWLRDTRPNVMFTDEMMKRLEDADDPHEESIRFCAETIRAMSEIPGLSGVNIVATRDLTAIPRAIAAAGIRD